MADVKVRVLWPLQGDRLYARDEERMLPEADAKRLAETGAVEILSGKAAPPVKNKVDRKVENKNG